VQLLQKLADQKYDKFAIIAYKFERPVLNSINSVLAFIRTGMVKKDQHGNIQKPLLYFIIKAPALTTDKREDVAIALGAKFINKDAGMELKDVKIEDLGFAEKIICDEDNTNLVGGAGKPVDIAVRCNEIRMQIDNEKDPSFKGQLKQRLSALQSGFAVIRVGAATDPEREYIKHKIRDAANAAQAAMAEGVIKGGGLVLKEFAETLGKEHPMYRPLRAPWKKIQDSAGGKLEIAEDILDPVKVERLALENGLSIAASLITAEGEITQHDKTLWDALDEKLSPKFEGDDFRHNSNRPQRFNDA
jgi:chaperonin GroEL